MNKKSNQTDIIIQAEHFKQWANQQDNRSLKQALALILKPPYSKLVQVFCGEIDQLLAVNDQATLAFITAGIQTLTPKRPLAFQQLAGVFQFNPIIGAVERNASIIEQLILLADAMGLDTLVLPEMALIGYPLKDLSIRFPHLVEQNMEALHKLALATHHTRVIIGFVEPRNLEANQQQPLVGKPYYISVAILGNRQIQGIVRKNYLPTYHEYDDARTIEPSLVAGVIRPVWVRKHYPHAQDVIENGLITIHGFKVGITICEDLWNNTTISTMLYSKAENCRIKAYYNQPELDWHINVSASVSRAGKEAKKQWLLESIAKETNRPLLYVNAVGGQDECIFDGASRLINESGDTIARSKAFAQQFQLMPLNCSEKSSWQYVHPLPTGMNISLYPTLFSPNCTFSSTQTEDLARTYEALVLGIQDYFKKTGFKKAVLGLSGGLDSAVTAVLLADALGAENVFGFSFPSHLTPKENESDAEILACNLGIGFHTCPIGPITETFLTPLENTLATSVTPLWGKSSNQSFAKDNVQAMARATMLRLVSNNYNALPIATSDKSELYMGYATINGDLSGALAPLGDVCKTKLRLLAKWLNTYGKTPNALPISVIDRPSGADLALNPATGALLTAEEALMPYVFLDEIIWRIEVLHQPFEDQLVDVFEYEQTYKLSFDKKRAWLEKFYQRMQFSVFKWQISPPILIVDGEGTLAKTAYRHPVLATACHWWNEPINETLLRTQFDEKREAEAEALQPVTNN